MSMNEEMRLSLIGQFDESRSAFLAALDQIVAELRPTVMALPGFYGESVVNCASAFADSQLVVDQLIKIHPDLVGAVGTQGIADAHLTSVCYLFALAVHEMVRNHQELPQ